MSEDLQHLKLLSIFHYVAGGITALLACMPIVLLVVGVGIMSGLGNTADAPVPLGFIGIIFVLISGAMIVAGWALAGCQFLAGFRLSSRANYTFCFVVAGVECILIPFGTALGVFTIIVLTRPSVRELFGRPAGAPQSQGALVRRKSDRQENRPFLTETA